jgi:hypothetical protein
VTDSDVQGNVKMGDILNDIAQEIAEMVGSLPDHAFLYLEADDEGREASLFTEQDDGILCHRPSDEMFELVGELWDATDDDKKWAAVEYDIADGKFEASFIYAEQLDPEEISDDRRERALRKRFGDTPVIYPAIGPNAVRLTPDDFAHLDDD